ncbi:MAG TPA: cobalamin-dependent protein, partial [Ilumatobacteraceae bacterium]|nr:cobalamin-dependent protein [Ilumatobacteraceae bacterium]
MPKPANPVRFVTAASLFDGHDASINIMRRILQAQGAEVIHLGHNRSVDDVVRAAVQEDAQGVAISSYQGGHVEYFTYLVERLRELGRGDIKIFGGGGGVIIPAEIEELQRRGVSRIFSPQDGQQMGLVAMIASLVEACDTPPARDGAVDIDALLGGDEAALARSISAIESQVIDAAALDQLRAAALRRTVPVVGITGTGGSGKSSLTDELIRRLRIDQADKVRIAVIAIDPSRSKGGGALLGDRIRMNTLDSAQVYFRSLATRPGDDAAGRTVPHALSDTVIAAKAWGADLVIVETPGIGQGDAAIVQHVDIPIYVMTPEFGASTQLERDVTGSLAGNRPTGHDAGPAAPPRRWAGLTSVEASARHLRDGPNALPQPERRSHWAIVLSVVREPMLLLLLAATTLYLVLGDTGEALLLALSVLAVIGLTIYQEQKSERALEALRELGSPRARALRDGSPCLLPAGELVVGDVIFLAEGDRVPADARLLEAIDLQVDESLLSGESVPLRRRVDGPGEEALV